MQLPFKDKVQKFLNEHHIAVLGTSDSENQPHTSTVFYYVAGKDDIRFITKTKTSKYDNLQGNPKASLTVVDQKLPIAVNMIGVVEKIEDGNQHDETLKSVMELSRKKIEDYPPIVKIHSGSFVAYKFIPSKAKLTDYTRPMGAVNPEFQDY